MNGSIFIDNILSQDETSDVMSMFDMADELKGGSGLLSFCTSTQMKRMTGGNAMRAPALSPIQHEGRNSERGREIDTGKKREGDLGETRNERNSLSSAILTENEDVAGETRAMRHAKIQDDGNVTKGETASRDGARALIGDEEDVMKSGGGKVSDPDTVDKHDPEKNSKGGVMRGEGGDGEPGDDGVELGDGEMELQGDGGEEDEGEGEEKSADDESVRESDEEDLEDIAEGGVKREGELATQMSKMIELLSKLDNRSANMDVHVKNLESSLEFSQQEIDSLKKENAELKGHLETLATEDKRTQFQLKAVDDRMERLETVAKKKNLVFEGVPEVDGKREEVEKTVGRVLDKLSINKPINLDACYRVGPYGHSRPRSIIVNFEKQADRDAVYERRIELKSTRDFQQVWINEDVGPASKRKQGILRLISREAQNQGIDCRSGKYAIHIDRVKYDDNNWDDLPRQLQPASLKQVKIDKDTLAYQSEFAPFSNFFCCDVKFGQHTFFCLEQAYQFVRAKTLNKPLAATRIFLSRDVHYIKQVGNGLGTSELWEKRKYDVMYVCLMSKFEQNESLRELLLNTGKLQLVEATPDRLWGCGATLSSNALRRHSWPGKNKHGETLMTVREELRRREEKKKRDN